MDTHQNDIDVMLDKLESGQKKRRLFSLLYTGLPLIIGLVLSFWTMKQAQDLNAKSEQSITLEKEIRIQKESLDSIRSQLQRTREASEHIRIGVNYFHDNNYKAAIRAYDRAIDLDPNNPLAFDLKGYSLLRDGRPGDAVKILRRAIELDSTYIWGYYDLALAYWSAGARQDAIREVQTVIALNPDFREVIKGDGQFSKFTSSKEFQQLMNK
jgi:tetratricopeptide (TPR) repeat protein